MATAFKQVSDNASSVVVSSLALPAVTSIDLKPGTGAKFPQPGNGFYATIWDLNVSQDPGLDPNMEQVLVSARSTDNVTVSATVNAHTSSNIGFALLDVAQITKDIQNAINAIENAAVLLGGRAGGQTISGGTASGNNLIIQSTIDATKGKTVIGATLWIDEVLNRLGIGAASPAAKAHVNDTDGTTLLLSTTTNAAGAITGIEFRYGGGGNNNIAQIQAVTASGGGGALTFLTAPGGASPYTIKMTLARDGSLRVGDAVAPTSTLDVSGSLGLKRTNMNDANLTAGATDMLIALTAITANRVLTLPNATTVGNRTYLVKDESNSLGTLTLTIATSASQTIDGASNLVMNKARGFVWLYSDGANWRILASDTTISTSPSIEVTTTSQQASVNKKYIANNAGLVTITLPANAIKGDQVSIRGKGAGGWKLAQNASQTIYGVVNTTTGTGGSLASQTRYDTVTVECITDNNDWIVVSKQGTLTVV